MIPESTELPQSTPDAVIDDSVRPADAPETSDLPALESASRGVAASDGPEPAPRLGSRTAVEASCADDEPDEESCGCKSRGGKSCGCQSGGRKSCGCGGHAVAASHHHHGDEDEDKDEAKSCSCGCRTVSASTVSASTVSASTVSASTVPASTVPASTVPASTVPASTVPASTVSAGDVAAASTAVVSQSAGPLGVTPVVAAPSAQGVPMVQAVTFPQAAIWPQVTPSMLVPTFAWPPFSTPPAPAENSVSSLPPSDGEGRGDLPEDRPRDASSESSSQAAVRPQDFRQEISGKVYALGKIGVDFGSEARRASFLQHAGLKIHASAREILEYLTENPHAATALTWTLNHDEQPIYAVRPEGPYAAEAYALLRRFLTQQQEILDQPGKKSEQRAALRRVSLAGCLSGTTRLLNRHEVPVVVPELRGSHAWSLSDLIEKALGKPPRDKAGREAYQERVENITNFLERIYYEVRNLGRSSSDRAINFAATVGFLFVAVYQEAIEASTQLDSFSAEPNPVARPDADVWDVKAVFFNPEHRLEHARTVYRFTIDVTDVVPFSLGDVKKWYVY